MIMFLTIPLFLLFSIASTFAQANPSQTPSVGDIVGDVLWIRPIFNGKGLLQRYVGAKRC